MKKFYDFKVHSYAIKAEFFPQVHKHTKIQFVEKVKWNSKIYLLGGWESWKSFCFSYHLKQTSWQSMHNCESFRTSKISGLKFFEVHERTKINPYD